MTGIKDALDDADVEAQVQGFPPNLPRRLGC